MGLNVRQVAGLGYAFGCYAITGLTVPLFLLFAGDMLLPRTVGDGPHASTAAAVAGNVGLLLLFGLQHSVMARPAFKARFARVVPPALERSTYVLAAGAAIWALCLGWRPVGGTVWRADGVAGTVLDVGFWLGFAVVYAATLLLDHTHLLGLRQAVRHYVRGEADATSDRLQVRGPYRLVRHPLMTGLLLCFWCASTMSAGRLLWAGGLTAYVLVGTVLEERDLVARFGDAYRRYRTEVAAFVPRPAFLLRGARSLPANEARP